MSNDDVARVSARARALSDLIHEWTADARTDADAHAIEALRAVEACLLSADEDGFAKLGEAARAVLNAKTSEAHRTLDRRARAACETIAKYARGEAPKDAVTRAVLAVVAMLSQHPDAFPADHERASAAVEIALIDCAARGTSPMGRVLRAWGCDERATGTALRNVQRESKGRRQKIKCVAVDRDDEPSDG
ncbi:hypothetical protein AKJ09_08984 [Labilithrix luteola]|uniref:Uncharacterized protein n=1 Tax=Labilithrix luteola TaxID=1391654 RepID=A0A0K1Q955_9BACT|nr:hypothetical protein [Labilithrix luteola]AKV02321.1 hypothetical protein AKJ09_08984 [Labilithrix luteola]